MKLSEYEKQYREKHGLSLRAMAERCNCSFQYLSKMEKDEIRRPSMEMIVNLANGMGMSVHDLLNAVDDLIIGFDGEHEYASIRSTVADIDEIENSETMKRLHEYIHFLSRNASEEELDQLVRIIETLYPKYIKEE